LRVSDLRELFDCAETLGRVKSPPGKRLAILTNGGGIGVLAVDRLAELGGIPADISPAIREKLDAVLPPTWSGSNPIDIVGDADSARYSAALEVLLADPGNDAVLVMNVQTAIARADETAAAVAGVVERYRAEHRMSPKPVLAVWVGAEQAIGDLLSGAGIPNYPTEDDAVRGFMHLVRHREVVEALAQVPPAMPSEFIPDVDTARQVIATTLADDRHWLDPIEVKRLFDAYDIPSSRHSPLQTPIRRSPTPPEYSRKARPSCSRSCRAASCTSLMSAASCSISPARTQSARRQPILSREQNRCGRTHGFPV
jgi:acetyltransferase